MGRAFILDLDFLDEQNLSAIEFLALIKINETKIDFVVDEKTQESLQKKQFVKLLFDNEKRIIILREKSKLLLNFLLIETKSSDYITKKVIKKSERIINNDIDNFIDNFRLLWKGLKVGSMGSSHSCKDKMIRWMSENPSYEKEEILKAARIYIKSLNDYTYLQAADYFIFKKDGKEESSRLSAFIDETEVNNTNWTTKLN